MSADNLGELGTITTPPGVPLEDILAVPGRRYGDFNDLLQPLHKRHFAKAGSDVIAALERSSPDGRARSSQCGRTDRGHDATIKALEDQAAEWPEAQCVIKPPVGRDRVQ